MSFEPLESTDPEAVGPYRLLARLGAGGMGRVYLARSAGGRTVAVKVVRAELAEDADFRERFRREVSAAQAVDGAYTAPVVDADRDGPAPWLATAYVLGPSLTEAVAAHGPLPVGAVRALGAGLAQALTAVHHAGLVHRDLKPSNVLLAADGPRVIDFGIARALDGDKMTSTGVVVGSPGFMSPEQASGLRMGPPGDVFSLGSVLVFAATGAGPFSRGEDGEASAATLLYRIIHGEPDLTDLPAELRPAITACLAKYPADRPTPAELAALLGGQEALARGGWLPAPVSSDIATHAATVLDMETPARGSAAVPADPRTAGGPATAFDRPTGTVRLGSGPTPAPIPAAEGEAPAPSRRRLLAGGGAALVAVLGGGTVWALTRSGDKPSPPPSPGPTSASPSPLATKSHAPGTPPAALWEYRITSSSFGTAHLAFGPDTVYLGGGDLIALDLANGKERFTKQDAAAAHLTVAGGTVSYGMITDLLTVDATTGALLWKFTPPKPAAGAKEDLASDIVLGADEKAVYAMCSFIAVDGSGLPDMNVKPTPGIMAVSRKDGSVLWTQRRSPNADLFVESTLIKDTLVYTNTQKELIARSTTDGHQTWVATTDSQAEYLPITDGERIYTSAAPNGLQAVNAADGKQAWVKTSDRSTRLWYSPPAVGGGVVYAVLGGMTMTVQGTTYTPTAPPALIALQATNGQELWRLELPSEVSMNVAPALVKDTLFVPTDAKGIYAVDVKNRKLRWTFQNGVADALPWQFGTDGQRLIAVQGDRVYALPPE